MASIASARASLPKRRERPCTTVKGEAPASMAERARRLALVVGGLVAGLALLELVLRLAALLAPTLLTRSRPLDATTGLHVLCVGDSHTFGVMVPPDRAYPERLERRLRAVGIDARVYNLGLPGQSSRQVLERLPDQLATYRPDVVLVWAGMNNYWNLKGRDDDPERDRWRVWRDLRLVRFLRLLRLGLATEAAFDRRRPDAVPDEKGIVAVFRWRIAGPGGEEVVDMPRSRANLDAATVERLTREDLTAIVRLVRASGATPVLITYPFPLTDNVVAVNRAVQQVEVGERALVVHTLPIALWLRLRGHRDVAFRDLHPNAVLYRSIGWEAARELVRARVVPRPRRVAALE
jgi:lysophospholipase L1-like esterase